MGGNLDKCITLHLTLLIVFNFSFALMILSFGQIDLGRQCRPRSSTDSVDPDCLHCLPFCLHLLDALVYSKTTLQILR